MTPACWNAIDRAREAVDIGLSPSRVGGDSQRVQATLAEVADFALDAINHASATFRSAQIAQVEALLILLACFVDERAVHRLPAQHRGFWPWLQLRWLGRLTGGTAFYEALSSALHDPASHEEVLDLAGYCLANGYKGRLAGDDDARQEFRRQIELALNSIGRHASSFDSIIAHLPTSRASWLTPRLVYAACTMIWMSLIIAFINWK